MQLVRIAAGRLVKQQELVVLAFQQAVHALDVEAGDPRLGLAFVRGREAFAVRSKQREALVLTEALDQPFLQAVAPADDGVLDTLLDAADTDARLPVDARADDGMHPRQR